MPTKLWYIKDLSLQITCFLSIGKKQKINMFSIVFNSFLTKETKTNKQNPVEDCILMYAMFWNLLGFEQTSTSVQYNLPSFSRYSWLLNKSF